MERRTLLKSAALSAVAISATDFIEIEGDHFVGDCETRRKSYFFSAILRY
jgi:catechol 1,2-dioxygenase